MAELELEDDSRPPRFFDGYLTEPLSKLFKERGVEGAFEDATHWSSIVDDAVGVHDPCARCNEEGGFDLWGPSTYNYLYHTAPSLAPDTGFVALLKGGLSRNLTEVRYVGSLIEKIPKNESAFEHIIQDVLGSDYKTPEYEDWKADDWLCTRCLTKFLKANLHLWLLDKKIQGEPSAASDTSFLIVTRGGTAGDELPDDCWYGWNCSTQIHNFEHARKLNVSAVSSHLRWYLDLNLAPSSTFANRRRVNKNSREAALVISVPVLVVDFDGYLKSLSGKRRRVAKTVGKWPSSATRSASTVWLNRNRSSVVNVHAHGSFTMSDYIPTIDDLRVKLCYICREEETYDKPEDPPRKWTHPCQCTLLAHEDCLLEWIKTAQTKSSTTAADNALKCPQCGARYQLESDLPLSMRMMNEALTAWNKSLGRMGRWFLALVPVGIVAGVAVGTHFVLTQYGAYAVKEFFGEELFNAVLTSDPHNWSISALINLPLIPIGLICYRFNSSYNLFPAISTLLEWPSLHKRGLPQHNMNVLAWPPSPFTVGFIAMPIIRYLYGKCLDRFTRWLLGPTPRTLLGRATGNRPVIDRADDDEDRMLILRFRGGQGPEPENENQGNDADGNQASLTIYASPLGRKIGGALLIPFIARRMGNLLLRFSKRSEFLRRLLAVRSPSSTLSTWPFASASSSSLFSGKVASGIATSPPVTWKLVLRAIWGGGRAWAEFDPVWWRNTLGFGLFVVAKDALHLLHLYLVKKEVDTRRVRNRDFRDIDITSLDVMPDADARRRTI
ncbi:hypothetical protein PM082_017907 [Marasmius tenuissimus]|nr:hypothetical protein PM082_017907 [Marasmius tenuissimus]